MIPLTLWAAVDLPTGGFWRIEVRGTAIAEGPQSFALTADGDLRRCRPSATLSLDRKVYACNALVAVTLQDCDLNADDAGIEVFSALAASVSDPSDHTVLLTESASDAAIFTGTVALAARGERGDLAVADGDTITVRYGGAGEGGGEPATLTASAAVDCMPPKIEEIGPQQIDVSRALLNIDSNEEATIRIRYGAACAALGQSASSPLLRKTHVVELRNLQASTTYFFVADVSDAAGNSITLDDGGACFSFTTPSQPDYFTAGFTAAGVDLSGRSVTFTPDGSRDYYAACVTAASAFPTDPAGGQVLDIGDDGSAEISFGAEAVSLHGASYASLFVNANGNLTFGAGDPTYSVSYSTHFAKTRISPLFVDLNSLLGGTISWKQLADRVAITFDSVRSYQNELTNSFQIELFFDGRIRSTYPSIGVGRALVGLSNSRGLPVNFVASNFGTYPACALPPPTVTPTPTPTPTPTATAGAARHRILYYANTTFASAVPGALARLGETAGTTIAASVDDLALRLATQGPWDLVIVGEQTVPFFAAVNAPLMAYVEAGGPVLASTRFADLATLLQARIVDSNAGVVTIERHAVFTGLPDSIRLHDPGYGSEAPFSVSLEVAGDSEWYGELGDGTAVILGHGERTLLNGPSFDAFADLAEGEHFVANEIAFLLGLTSPVEFFYSPGEFDLEFRALTYEPDPLSGTYAVCTTLVSQFPVDGTGRQVLELGDDDFIERALTDGASIPFYEQSYDRFYVGSNGYVTFGSGDAESSLDSFLFFNRPRIAALMGDLEPNRGGLVWTRQLTDRAVVTFEDVPRFNAPTIRQSFQIEMFFRGTIRVTYLQVGGSGASGLSRGFGPPSGFVTDDLSRGPGCVLADPTPARTPTATVVPNGTPALDIIYFEDAPDDSVVPGALGSLGLESRTTTASDIADFRTKLAGSSWKLVIFGEETGESFLQVEPELTAHLADGGKILATTWRSDTLAPLFDAAPVDVNQTDLRTTDHPIFSGLGASVTVVDSPATTSSRSWAPLAGATGIGELGEGSALILGNRSRTLLQGPRFDRFENPATGARLVANEIAFLLSVPDESPYPSEIFTDLDNDLAHLSLTYTPDSDGYRVCASPAIVFPTDPTGGTPLALYDDHSMAVLFTDGAMFPFFGTSYDRMYIGSNGYLTFDEPDITFRPTFDDHFRRVRIAALFDDLNPPAAGMVSWRQLADRVAVTYDGIPLYGRTEPNQFQIELFFDGHVRVTYLTLNAEGLAGVSPGGGLPPTFFATDLSSSAPCAGGGATATPTISAIATPTPTSTVAVNARLRMAPDQLTAGPGAVFNVNIELDPGSDVVDSAEAFIDFDPADLEVLAIIAGDALPLVRNRKIDNTSGQIDLAADAAEIVPTSTFVLARLQIRAKQLGQSLLHFSTAAPRRTDVRLGGSSRLAGVEDGHVGIDANDFDGAVRLHGRSMPPDPRWVIPFTVEFYPLGSGPAQSCVGTTNESGLFSCDGLLPGSYTACVKNPQTLSNCLPVTVPTTMTVDFGVLRAGDANDDNCVRLVDYAILASTFG